MRHLCFLLPFLLAGCGLFAEAPPADATRPEAAAAPRVHEKTIESQPYHIDARYASMQGPYGIDQVRLLDGPQPELLWITGYETTVVDAAEGQALSQEFMCHANLDLNPTEYFKTFTTSPSISGRLFTLSQGQQRIDFPEGFGIPVSSDLPLSLATQVLNLNLDDPDLRVKHQVKVRFVRDAETTRPMRPLFQAAVEGFKALADARHYGFAMDEVSEEDHGAGCSVGQAAIAGDVDKDHLGQQFTAHWVVEPGEEINRTNVTRFLNLQFDTTAHYIAVHLHPFAEKLELIDLTTGEPVFVSHVKPSEGRIGIDHVEYFTSEEGLQLYKDHQYELVSYYNNTSDQPVDSMAVMYMYLLDKQFQKPERLVVNN